MKRIHKTDQAGMVAIIVTMIMMFVITLIVLGFSEVTRRNQREAVDTQLGIQAYYAAETGVNDITNAINAGALPVTQPDCTNFTFGGLSLPRTLTVAPDTTVANTCLMMNPEPASMTVDAISASSESVVWNVQEAAGNAFTKLMFDWGATPNATGTCSTPTTEYPKLGNWACDRGLLRVDIIRADIASADAATLAANTATLYLKPSNNTQNNVTLTTFDSTTNGRVTAYKGACKVNAGGNPSCRVTVNLVGASAQTSRYYVRLSALYQDVRNVELTGLTAIGPATFKDGQVVVDSTGRAQDQLKRIRVRIPLTLTGGYDPTNAVQSAGSTCKDILIPGSDYQIGACNNIWPL